MCGRYASSRSADDLAAEFEILDARPERVLPPSYNVAPTDEVYAVMDRPRHGETVPVRQLRVVRWGLVPSWAKDPGIGSRLINARLETVADKPAFRTAFARRRCLVPADGYFEWYATEQRTAKGAVRKQPFFIHPTDGSVLAMAGLYELWRDPTRSEEDPRRWRWTCTVLTTDAPDDLGRIHDRMPLLVSSERRAEWLDPSAATDHLADLLVPAQQHGLTAHPVSTAVGNVANNGPELLDPLPPEDLPTIQESLL